MLRRWYQFPIAFPIVGPHIIGVRTTVPPSLVIRLEAGRSDDVIARH
jgi:hypothetical protein